MLSIRKYRIRKRASNFYWLEVKYLLFPFWMKTDRYYSEEEAKEAMAIEMSSPILESPWIR